MKVLDADCTDLFVGSEKESHQVAQIRLADTLSGRAAITIEGNKVRSLQRVEVDLTADQEKMVEVPLQIEGSVGELLEAEVAAESESGTDHCPLQVVVEEPGWTMFMVSHFHYDPVWWNTQAAYTETWKKTEDPWVGAFQTHSFALVKSHLDAARRDPDYAFVLAELDYLKPYWNTFPEDRVYMRRLMAEGRLELIGGTYNEPNTNLVASENTVRNLIYGIAYQRDVLGGSPATAWQLDAFGHDPQFPGLAADAGLTSSSWARGPFHAWGPFRMPVQARPQASLTGSSEPLRMEFPSEFYWVAPSGKKLLTSYMADHYSSGWWMDSAVTLEEACEQTYACYQKLKSVAATKNVLLPVGSDYTPPNKWVSKIARSWNSRYVSPRFEMATTRRFFAAVREAVDSNGIRLRSQSRDMNPLYTGKDVSFIDTKQANRLAENTLLDGEKFATVASLLGARFPQEAIDKAWRQLLFNAHHDGITGSESDQVYLDILGGWREAWDLGRAVLNNSLRFIGDQIDTPDEGQTLAVFNPSSWPRSGLVRFDIRLDRPATVGLQIIDSTGARLPALVEVWSNHQDGSLEQVTVSFYARDIPPIGYASYRIRASDDARTGWVSVPGLVAESERYLVEVDPGRGGGVTRLYDKLEGRELLEDGQVGNELLACDEYPNHPSFGEGPWHLTPTGAVEGTSASTARVQVEQSPIGKRLIVETELAGCEITQEIELWNEVDWIGLRTKIDGFNGHDKLFRVRFPVDCEGATPVSEVGSAVIGRTFGFPEADTAQVPFTLEYPAYNWFGLTSCLRLQVEGAEEALQAISVVEVIAPDSEGWAAATEQLISALVRQGVTATVSSPEDARYGSIDIDSNLPDARISLGGPDENRFTASVIETAGKEYQNDLKRQLTSIGHARVWVPAQWPLKEIWVESPDLRHPRALPVLIVADRGGSSTSGADLATELSGGVISVDQSLELAGAGSVVDYGVAIFNRGIPGFTVDYERGLYLSLMRSSSGWPSGIWIDPPRRTLPDGAHFQYQHWTHTFEYALAGFKGDWRDAKIVNRAHDYNHSLLPLVIGPHSGNLPERLSFFEVTPDSVVMTALKPLGNPLAHQAGDRLDPREGIAARVYETKGEPGRATINSHWNLQSAFITNLMEEERISTETGDRSLALDLTGYQVATVGAIPQAVGTDAGARLGPTREACQPVFAPYWLHNKGAAPLGYQPLTVKVRPPNVGADGLIALTVTVASEATDRTVAGTLRVVAPEGWAAEPDSRPYRLAVGAHLISEINIKPAPEAAPGRYFVAVQIEDAAGQIHEDVATIDYGSSASQGSGGELEIELVTKGISLMPGAQSRIDLRVHNQAASAIRGEAQLLSPFDIWSVMSPWTQGFEVAGGTATELGFSVEIPLHCSPGSYWSLVKIMYFGRIYYTEAFPVEIGR
ncbi:MAG: glycoside hydrolase family 38 C-terminal domain-containing protein [Acidimicrobiia bacterium]